MRSTGTSSTYPFCTIQSMATWISTGIGLYCGWLNSSMMRLPRSIFACVAASSSEPNCAKAASSRNCARSPLSRPATCFMAFSCAADPTRDTEMPDRDGRPDALIEQIRFQEDLAVGDRDDVGRDVRRHVAGLRFDDRQRRQRTVAELSPRRGRRVRAAGCGGRTRRPDTLRGRTAASARATPAGRPRRAWRDRRRRSARPCRGP